MGYALGVTRISFITAQMSPRMYSCIKCKSCMIYTSGVAAMLEIDRTPAL